MNTWQKRDLNTIWHPCSQMKDYEVLPPIVVERGQGIWLYDTEGNRYLDAVSSWWVNLFGHSNPRLNKALIDQVQKLEHVIFANFSHAPAIELSEAILKRVPEGLSKVFFADNGSSAIEAALKMSFQYHQQTGSPERTRFLALTDAYHGETLGALSVGDIDLYNKTFRPLLLNTLKAVGPDCYRCPKGLEREKCNAECFEAMENLVGKHHKELCGIIIEPMIQCAAGMKIYSAKYLKKLRKLCDAYDIHLIADEIAVGFGRTGKMFACEHGNITPDIMCLSKGITAGYLPLALAVTTEKIYNAFYGEYQDLKAFLHSHSYTGNPLACSVALESLKIFDEGAVIEKNGEKASYLKSLIEPWIKSHPNVGEFRQLGMIGAVELVHDKALKQSFPWEQRIGYRIYQKALEKGVLLRPLGNILYFMPPYVIEKDELKWMVEMVVECTEEFFEQDFYR